MANVYLVSKISGSANNYRLVVPGQNISVVENGANATISVTGLTGFPNIACNQLSIVGGNVSANFDSKQIKNFTLTLNQNTNVTFSNPVDGGKYTFIVKQTGNSNIVWPANIFWHNGVLPTLGTTTGSFTIVTILYCAEFGYFGDFVSRFIAA